MKSLFSLGPFIFKAQYIVKCRNKGKTELTEVQKLILKQILIAVSKLPEEPQQIPFPILYQ